MKKLTFNALTIELTRKCNMTPICLHCMRGNPQDITIKKDTIDTILKQTIEIGKLLITGGEPTLCLDELDYIYQKLVEYRIPLFSFELTTNGLIYDDRFIDIIKKYSNLITICREIDFPNDVLPPFMETNVQVSLDKYHNHSEVAKNNFEKYKNALKRIAQVTICTNGNFTKKCGNAKINNLKSYTPFYITANRLNDFQIGIIDKENSLGCETYPTFNLVHPEQVLICCGIEIKCDGNLIRSEIGDLDYETMDNPKYQICNVNDDIYSQILRYNTGRISCAEWKHKLETHKLLDIFSHANDFRVAAELYDEREKARTPDTYVINNSSL